MSPRPRRTALGVRDMTVIALIGVMVLVGKSFLRMPISVPGHSGTLWIAALIIGRGIVRRPGAATAMGVVGGLLVAFLQPSDAGLFAIAKYVVPAATLDALAWLFGERFDRIGYAVVAGAAALAMKLPVDYVIGRVQGIPHEYLIVGLTLSAVSHVAFGALGGLIGALVLRAMHRARIPQLRGARGEADPS